MFAWGKSYKERFFALSVCVHCCRPCANRCRGFRQENISDGLGRCDLLGRLAISYGRWSNRDAQDERNALDGGFYLPQFFPRLVFDHVGLRKSKYELLVRKRVNCSRLAAIRAHRISVGQRVDGKICRTKKSRGVEVAEASFFAQRVAVLHRSFDRPKRLRNDSDRRILLVIWILHFRNCSILFNFARNKIARRRREWLQTCGVTKID